MDKKSILVIGSINADHVLQVPQFAKPGETVTGHSYRVFAGGKGGNQAVACARSGGNTRFLACAGDDDFARSVTAQYQQTGMDTSAIQYLQGHKTGVAVILVSEDAENSIGISAEANACLDAAVIKRHKQDIAAADYLLMQLETPMDGIESAADIAQQTQTVVILNPAPARALSDQLLAKVHIITPNQTEAQLLTGITVTDEGSARNAAAVLHNKGVTTVVITMGSQGAFVSGPGLSRLIPTHATEAVDTTAAGDTFNGAMVTALSEGQDLESAVLFAHSAAAISVTRVGALSSIPTRQEILAFAS